MITRLKLLSIAAVLTAGIAGILAVYRTATEILPSHLYTPEAMEFLAFNDTRRIHQLAPTWNLLGSVFPASPMSFPGQKSRVVATLLARYESFENTTVTLFDLDFRGEYTWVHPGTADLPIEIYFPFPANLQTLHEVTFLVDGEEPPDVSFGLDGIRWQGVMEPGDRRTIVIGYKADGATAFTYALQQGIRADVDVEVIIDGLSGSQVSPTSLVASSIDTAGETQVMRWKYQGLIPDRDIQVLLPTRHDMAHRLLLLQGDFRDLSIAAPILVVVYILSLLGVFHLSEIRVRVEGFLLAGLAAALYFPALTFLAAVMPLVAAFALAFSVTAGLVLAFLSAMAGSRRSFAAAGVVSFACLGLLSFGLLTPWRGLSASLGGILLVGTFMVLLARQRVASPLEPGTEGAMDDEAHTDETPEPAMNPPAPGDVAELPALLHCPRCGHVLETGFAYCPGCGHDTRWILRCQTCGNAQVSAGDLPSLFCLRCGSLVDNAQPESAGQRASTKGTGEPKRCS